MEHCDSIFKQNKNYNEFFDRIQTSTIKIFLSPMFACKKKVDAFDTGLAKHRPSLAKAARLFDSTQHYELTKHTH